MKLRIAALALLVIFCGWAGLPTLRWIDIHFLKEALKDQWGEWYHAEDWSEPAPLPSNLDYSWLKNASRPILIAHALGEAGRLDQNSLAAQQRALSAGIKLLEIDIWLDEVGRLRCHHGPDAPAAPAEGECNLQVAAHAAAAQEAWLVLDIKTDFKLTGEAIFQQFLTSPSASRLIFQLYHPTDIQLFSLWASTLNLPGPIVTTYRARRSLIHIASQMDRIGVKAMTYPLNRGEAMPNNSAIQGLTRFVHPVHDCASLKKAKHQKAEGYYLLTLLASRTRSNCENP